MPARTSPAAVLPATSSVPRWQGAIQQSDQPLKLLLAERGDHLHLLLYGEQKAVFGRRQQIRAVSKSMTDLLAEPRQFRGADCNFHRYHLTEFRDDGEVLDRHPLG